MTAITFAPCGQWKRSARAEEGAAAIEMAFSIPALLLVVVGMMKLCLAVYAYHYTSEAAREGVRYAIVRGSSASSTACVNYEASCVASSDNISNFVKALGYPALSPSNMTVTVTRAGFPTGVICTPNAAPNCNNPGNMVTLTVQYAFPMSIPFRGSSTWNMSASSSGIIAQ